MYWNLSRSPAGTASHQERKLCRLQVSRQQQHGTDCMPASAMPLITMELYLTGMRTRSAASLHLHLR